MSTLSFSTSRRALLAAAAVAGAVSLMPAAVRASNAGDKIRPRGEAAYASLDVFYNHGFGYAEMMNTRPQTLGYALADSPVGMAAFFY
jgi:hypothetical protein